ncbi:MAG: hypothetical protein O2967_20495, partial [Proteobacteria bacterium]|nr:hypothetical protein [Pseudomonadota bacterium]
RPPIDHNPVGGREGERVARRLDEYRKWSRNGWVIEFRDVRAAGIYSATANLAAAPVPALVQAFGVRRDMLIPLGLHVSAAVLPSRFHSWS